MLSFKDGQFHMIHSRDFQRSLNCLQRTARRSSALRKQKPLSIFAQANARQKYVFTWFVPYRKCRRRARRSKRSHEQKGTRYIMEKLKQQRVYRQSKKVLDRKLEMGDVIFVFIEF